MKTPIVWAELHSPIFLAGTNLSQKLDPKKRTGLKMEFDETKRHLYVTWNGMTGRVPEASVLHMIEKYDAADEFINEIVAAEKAIPFDPGAAQVDSPTSHVFAGPGKGQTGRGGKVK